jgi:hypothetical protein
VSANSQEVNMELRYLGFDQKQNTRVYTFKRVAKGEPATDFMITVDLRLLLQHRISLQDGPALSARKLASDLESSHPGDHELTNEDLLIHVNARAMAEARSAEARGKRRNRSMDGEAGAVGEV